jgi:plasmid stability protein
MWLYVTMPKAVQIRDVPDQTIAVLRARAAAAGMSMSEYLRAELVSWAARPTVADVWARARARSGGVPIEEIVRTIREMRDDPEVP